jgi:hypothetical protein
MFCAQIVGNPVSAPLPAAAPAAARIERRPIRFVEAEAMFPTLFLMVRNLTVG